MEFFCVLSVGGSLASYHVQKLNEEAYEAVLRITNGKRDDIPAQFSLSKGSNGWQASPHHEEIAQSLIHAIESKER